MILSMLDNDLYKFTMQNAVLKNYPDSEVVYRFKDRNPSGKYNGEFLKALDEKIDQMADLHITDSDIEFIKDKLPFLARPDYLAYLHDYRYNPDQIGFELDQNNNLQLAIYGTWESAILWEVPLLALISETYFEHCDIVWDMTGQRELAASKAERLSIFKCKYADFGTRRRRCSKVQKFFLKEAINYGNFVGTSNVHFAKNFQIRPIGTMAHEWIMGVSGKEGVRQANHHALWRWWQTYDGNLGIALTDTFGTDAFFEEFDGSLARLYDGVRHDSGDPIEFGERVINHYQKLNIKPSTKTIVFSDGLDVKKARDIQNHFHNVINVSFGIGTHFTNDFQNSKPLNIVIKLESIDGVPVVKLSDEPGKEHGDRDAIRVAKWTLFGTPLDER